MTLCLRLNGVFVVFHFFQSFLVSQIFLWIANHAGTNSHFILNCNFPKKRKTISAISKFDFILICWHFIFTADVEISNLIITWTSCLTPFRLWFILLFHIKSKTFFIINVKNFVIFLTIYNEQKKNSALMPILTMPIKNFNKMDLKHFLQTFFQKT